MLSRKDLRHAEESMASASIAAAVPLSEEDLKGARCKEAGVRPSTGSVGDAYDNAMCESFFATLECELIDRRRFRSHSEARMAVFQFIRLLQSLTPPLGPGLSLAHRIRKEA
jgi:hypothetical protein